MTRELRLALASLFAVALGACARPAAFDPLATDPPYDRAQPAASIEASFESGGERMNAIVYQAAGAGPHPTAIVLHGFPGYERNLDIAQALRRAGWNTLVFHYRGAWGSGGSFGFAHVLEDVAAVVAQVRAPEFAARFRVDPARIALVGHSMGGFAALAAGADLAAVRCVASLAGANLGAFAQFAADPRGAAQLAAMLDGWSGPLRGSSGAELVREVAQNAQHFDSVRRAPALAAKPVLLVAATRDEITAPAQHHAPLVAALAAAGAAHLRVLELDADHGFSEQRVALTRAVLAFLQEECR